MKNRKNISYIILKKLKYHYLMYVLGLIDRVRAWEVAHCGLWICFGLDGGDLGLCRGGVLGFWTHMVPAVSGLIVLRFWLIVSTVSGL